MTLGHQPGVCLLKLLSFFDAGFFIEEEIKKTGLRCPQLEKAKERERASKARNSVAANASDSEEDDNEEEVEDGAQTTQPNKGVLELKTLKDSEWMECYRKGDLSKMDINVRANVYLLCLHVLPMMNPEHKNWGGNSTRKGFADCMHTGSEAWVLTMALDGQLEDKLEDNKKKRQCMSSKKVIEKHIESAEWLLKLRKKDPEMSDEELQLSAEWDKELLRMAKIMMDEKEKDRKAKLARKHELLMSTMDDEAKRRYKEKNICNEKKKTKLVMPEVNDKPMHVQDDNTSHGGSEVSDLTRSVAAENPLGTRNPNVGGADVSGVDETLDTVAATMGATNVVNNL